VIFFKFIKGDVISLGGFHVLAVSDPRCLDSSVRTAREGEGNARENGRGNGQATRAASSPRTATNAHLL